MADLLQLHAVPSDALVAVVSAAAAAQPEQVERGLDALRALGYATQPAEHMLASGPLYFAGSPELRLHDLHHAFADDTVGAIISTRGGYGSNYLLDELDLDLIAESAKPFIGYSDLTAMQLWLLDQIQMPAFHGPMVAADFARKDGIHLASFQAALAGEPYSVGAAEGLRVLKQGAGQDAVRGMLYGGCLSILVALLGTPYEPQTEGKLLFLEDVGAKPFQVDRMLWQLKAAGKLDGVSGIVFGEMLDCVSPGATPDLLEQAILNVLNDFDGPIAIGLRSGHVSHQNVTLTLGVEAELQIGEETQIRFLEPAVTP